MSQHEAEDGRKKEACQQEGYLQHFLSALKQKDVDINALTRTGGRAGGRHSAGMCCARLD